MIKFLSFDGIPALSGKITMDVIPGLTSESCFTMSDIFLVFF